VTSPKTIPNFREILRPMRTGTWLGCLVSESRGIPRGQRSATGFGPTLVGILRPRAKIKVLHGTKRTKGGPVGLVEGEQAFSCSASCMVRKGEGSISKTRGVVEADRLWGRSLARLLVAGRGSNERSKAATK